MRTPRIKAGAGQAGVYHCMSRVVGGQALLDDAGKAKLVELLHPLASYCGAEVITYCMMSNHFHLLVRIRPVGGDLTDEELLKRMEGWHGSDGRLSVLARRSMEEGRRMDASIRERVLARMGDVSVFIQEFKQRFSRWYNKVNRRTGYLWGERFKSVLVEDGPEAIRAMAAYIDLNPVRAGLVEDPKEYRYCGYAAALCGDRLVRQGVMGFTGKENWAAAAADYRVLLYVTGGRVGSSGKRVMGREEILAELKRGGRLGLGEVLRLRIRHLTDGAILGSKGFVDAMFELHREKFGRRRKDGARPIRGAPLEGLRVARDLRIRAVG